MAAASAAAAAAKSVYAVSRVLQCDAAILTNCKVQIVRLVVGDE